MKIEMQRAREAGNQLRMFALTVVMMRTLGSVVMTRMIMPFVVMLGNSLNIRMMRRRLFRNRKIHAAAQRGHNGEEKNGQKRINNVLVRSFHKVKVNDIPTPSPIQELC